MKKRLLGLLLALFTIVMFLSTVMNVYASGIPVDYTVNIPQVPARYPPSDGTWDVLWSYSAPSGQSVVTISPVIKNVNINNSVVVRIVCDGVTVLV